MFDRKGRLGRTPALLPLAGIAFVAAGAALPESVLAQAEAVSQGQTIEEIVVTARKREERVQDVPMAISAISGERLERAGGDNLRDIGSLFAGVSFNDSNGSGGEFSIRGLTSAGSGSDTSVGLYVDEVFVGDEASMSQRLYDLQTFQILKGPQGTLFGRNSVAGAVNIVTRKPEADFGGSVDITVGDYGLMQYGVTLNAPIMSDRLMTRVNYIDRKRDGYLKNSAQPGVRGNDEDGHSLRAHLLGRPTDTLEVLLSVDDSHDDTCDNMFKVIGGTLANGNTDPDISAWDGPCASVRDVSGVSLRADQKFSGMTLTSITAYRERDTEFLTDRDFTGLPILATGLNTDEHQFTQEVRLASAGNERVNWVVGAFWFERDYLQDTILDLGPGFLGPGLRNTVHALADTTTRSLAGFGSVEFHVTGALSAEVGLRYTSETKSLDYEQTATLPIPGFGVVAPFNKDVDGGEWSPTLTLTYRVQPDAMAYARIARGFKSGGFNAGPSSDPSRIEFAPEFLTSYEIGYKGVFLDGLATFDGDVFYLDYSDIQQSDQDGAGFYIGNAASARSYGVETQFSLRVLDRLSLRGGVGYVNAKYDDFGARSDNELARAPKWTGSLSAELNLPAGDAGSFVLMPEVAYRDANYVDSANTELFRQQANTVVNVRAGFESTAGWSVIGWVRNLTDERYTLGGFSVAPIVHAVTISAPRTYGVDLRWSF
jgi:iron complex outermembrane receptor protein